MDFPRRFEPGHPVVVEASLRDTLVQWWFTNQLSVLWALLLVPLALELTYGTFRSLYLVLVPSSILATYLIYRSAKTRLQA